MMSYLRLLYTLIIVIFFLLQVKSSYAQCAGTRTCSQTITTCVNQFGDTSCLPGPFDPTCVCTDSQLQYSVACSGIPPAMTCGGEPCLVGDSVVSDNCSSGPTPIPDPCPGQHNYCNGGASSWYCCAPYDTCTPSDPIDENFTCSTSPSDVCGDTFTTGSEQCDYGAGNDTQNIYRGGDVAGCGTDPASVCDAGCGNLRIVTCDSGGPTDNCTCPGKIDYWMSSVDGACLSTSYACPTNTPTPTPTSTPTPTPTPTGACAPGNCGACGTQAACTAQSCNWCGASCQAAACPTNTPTPTTGAPTNTPTPTSPPGATPTPTPVTFTISGNVYVDANDNGVKDAGDANYPGATVSRTPSGSTTTNASGNYTFSSLGAGTYTITLTVPVGYAAKTTNPVSAAVGPSTTVNFGIVIVPTPNCTSTLSANPSTLDAGSTSSLSVSGCSNTTPTPTPAAFVWTPVPGTTRQCNDSLDNDLDTFIDSQDPECHTDGNAANGASYDPFHDNEAGTNYTCSDGTIGSVIYTSTSSSSTYASPQCPSASLICTVEVDVSGPGGTNTYSTNITVNPVYPVIAKVQEDTASNNCVSGATDYTGNTTFSLSGVANETIEKNTTTGSITFACLSADSWTLSMGVPSGYRIVNRSVSPGPHGDVLSNGVSFSTGPTQTATFCITSVNPWIQTTTGDVRDVSLANKVPAGSYASTSVSAPSLFISSNWDTDFGQGSASSLGWTVNAEYDYGKDAQSRNGTANYTYYLSRINQTGVTTTTIPSTSCNASSCPIDGTNGVSATGVYRVDGPITITSYTHPAGGHVVLLVNGDVRVDTSIDVPKGQNNLLIIATNGDMTFGSTVGGVYTDTTTHVDGIFTAEGSVIAEGDSCIAGSPDLRLNIEGSVIANALKPFSTSGVGTFQNLRSLCANDLTTPSVTFSPRLDFITELTDFYRTISTRWKEAQP